MSESRSAAVGGVTTIIRMLRIHGSCKNIMKHLLVSQSAHIVDYRIHVSILDNLQLEEMNFLSNLGFNSFKIYMNLGSSVNRILADLEPPRSEIDEMEVNMTDDLLVKIAKNSAALNSLLIVHAEDHKECSRMMKNLSVVSNDENHNLLEIWSKARPTSSEVSSISKITKMAATFGANLYFAHIGSSDALREIMRSRRRFKNIDIWVETCPHYLTHSLDYNNLRGKVVPPIRSKTDVTVMWNAIQNGVIDTIGTDHVASNLRMKVVEGNLWKSLSGFPGLATMLPVMLSEGVNKSRMSLEKLSEICCYNPARIFGLYPKKGTIQCGADADLTIIDLEEEREVTPEILQGYSDYTIYEGWKLRGWPTMTLVRGRVVMENGWVDPHSIGHGRFVTTQGPEFGLSN